MVLATSNLRYTVEEYLALERKAEERHIYLDGRIYEMAGESPQHNVICVNLVARIHPQLRGTPCQALSKDMRVLSGPSPLSAKTTKGMFSYPDVVVCGEMKFHDRRHDILVNPSVIIEVLSDSTEAFDRGQKFLRYQNWNPTLTDYVLVSQASPLIEHFARQTGKWTYSIHQSIEDSVSIESINTTLQLVEVYDRIVFPVPMVDESSEEMGQTH